MDIAANGDVVKNDRRDLNPFHPAAWAGYGRARARGERPFDDVAIVRDYNNLMSQGEREKAAHAYTTAELRAYGNAGHDNRHARKRRRYFRIGIVMRRLIPGTSYYDDGAGGVSGIPVGRRLGIALNETTLGLEIDKGIVIP